MGPILRGSQTSAPSSRRSGNSCVSICVTGNVGTRLHFSGKLTNRELSCDIQSVSISDMLGGRNETHQSFSFRFVACSLLLNRSERAKRGFLILANNGGTKSQRTRL